MIPTSQSINDSNIPIKPISKANAPKAISLIGSFLEKN
jgi:hypothetical protein